MLRRVGTLKTYSSLTVLVTWNRPLSEGGRMSAPGLSTTPNGAYDPPPTLMPLWHEAHPLSMKSFRPAFWFALKALSLPRRYWSNGALGVINVASKAAMALPTLAIEMLSFSSGKAAANIG